MATVRVRYDRDLDHVIVEQVGGVVTHLDASTSKPGKVGIYQDASGAYSLAAGTGRTRIAEGEIVRAADIPNPAVTQNDLTGQPRQDIPVAGEPDKADVLREEVPAETLEKSAVGQTPTHDAVVADLQEGH